MSESAENNPRGRCWCGAWLPPGDPEEGIQCSNCLETHTPERLQRNGFEWSEARGEWVHPSSVEVRTDG